MIQSIPLNKLIPSPRNVRRRADEQADAQLKADIAARGLLQNLVVAPVKKPRGSFTVEAGGRRLRALQSLAGDGALDAAHEVSCLVIGGGAAAAQEASLAENFQRLAMNPADECLAFGQLIEQGADVEGIARRFGLTVRFIEGRLRLSALAPCVFEALGAGEISLDVAKAYAATADSERQAWVFEQLQGSYSGNHPDSIRRMMTQATASASDRRALLVGEDAYVAAGGRIERDLFSEEQGERWLDVALLENLAAGKMEALAAEKQAETGLAWVRPTLDSWVPYALTAGLRRIFPDREPLTEDEQTRLEALEARSEALVAILEDEDSSDEQQGQAETTIAELEHEIAVLRDKPIILEEAVKAELGVFLLLDESGAPRLDSVFYVEALAEEPAGSEPDGAATANSGESAATGTSPDAGPEDKPKPLSRSLIDELAIQRRDVLAVHVAADPELALDLATFLMVDRDAAYSSERSGSSLLALAPTDPVFGFKTPEANATIGRAKAVDELDRNWTSGRPRSERFDAFRALSAEAKAAWLGHAVARTLEASANASGERKCAFHDHLGQLLGVDVPQWWRPTGANYFDRVPKTVTLAALREVGGPAFASAYSGLKKAELSQSAERVFAGEFIGDAEVKQKALAWVPEPMRFAATPEAVGEGDSDELAPWEEEPASDDAHHASDAESGSGGDDGGSGGSEPSQVEEAA
jgi:ParB family transcriptional regulator, chromosome partitioning protein